MYNRVFTFYRVCIVYQNFFVFFSCFVFINIKVLESLENDL